MPEHELKKQQQADDYYLENKENMCVVCGAVTQILRYHMIPSQYRKHFPGRHLHWKPKLKKLKLSIKNVKTVNKKSPKTQFLMKIIFLMSILILAIFKKLEFAIFCKKSKIII